MVTFATRHDFDNDHSTFTPRRQHELIVALKKELVQLNSIRKHKTHSISCRQHDDPTNGEIVDRESSTK